MTIIRDDWKPTEGNINLLPDPLRRYIHDLETNADPALTIRENIRVKEENDCLQRAVADLNVRLQSNEVHNVVPFHEPEDEVEDETIDEIAAARLATADPSTFISLEDMELAFAEPPPEPPSSGATVKINYGVNATASDVGEQILNILKEKARVDTILIPSHSKQAEMLKPAPRIYNHYFKDVRAFTHIDVYRVLQLFAVTDPCLQHAIKKLLVAGGRGAKDIRKDVEEAVVSCNRFLEMREEDLTAAMGLKVSQP